MLIVRDLFLAAARLITSKLSFHRLRAPFLSGATQHLTAHPTLGFLAAVLRPADVCLHPSRQCLRGDGLYPARSATYDRRVSVCLAGLCACVFGLVVQISFTLLH